MKNFVLKSIFLSLFLNPLCFLYAEETSKSVTQYLEDFNAGTFGKTIDEILNCKVGNSQNIESTFEIAKSLYILHAQHVDSNLQIPKNEKEKLYGKIVSSSDASLPVLEECIEYSKVLQKSGRLAESREQLEKVINVNLENIYHSEISKDINFSLRAPDYVEKNIAPTSTNASIAVFDDSTLKNFQRVMVENRVKTFKSALSEKYNAIRREAIKRLVQLSFAEGGIEAVKSLLVKYSNDSSAKHVIAKELADELTSQ